MFVLPLPEPPREDRKLFQPVDCQYAYDSRGFYAFKVFTSRIFLMSKTRFQELLPMKFMRLPMPERICRFLKGQSIALPWEVSVTNSLKQTSIIRADLDSPLAWSLHLRVCREKLYLALPEIIKRVEAGHYSFEQAGNYDLDLCAFMAELQ